MAFLFADSFDPYNSTSITTFLADAATHWDLASNPGGTTLIVASANTRFSSGQAINFGYNASVGGLTKSSGSNDAGHHLVFAYRNGGTATSFNGLTFTLLDGTTAQCSLVFDPSGPIYLKSGTGSGTILATWASPGLSLNTWYGIEVEIIIHPTAGSVAIRLNGNTGNDFQATGLNTRPGTNTYANKIQVGVTGTGNGTQAQWLDDFLWFSTSGAAPNTWVGDVRAQQLVPATDASVSLAPGMAPPSLSNTVQTNVSMSGNTLNSGPVLTVVYGGVASSLSMTFTSSFTGHIKLALYDGSTGQPGALLGQTAEQTNAAIGTMTLALLSPVTLVTGAKVYVCLLSDNIMSGVNCTSAAVHINGALAYTSGFPSTISAGNITGSGTSGGLAGTVNFSSITNASQVSQSAEDGDTSLVYGSTASVGDLYSIGSLGVTPTSIIAVQTRMAARKTDSGARQARVQVKSGTTTVNGATVTLGTSYSFAGARVDTVDPNTSAAWTAAAVNSLQIGPYVVA